MTGQLPRTGQKAIPLAEWRRFVRVADWWDRTFGHKPPAAGAAEYGTTALVTTPDEGIIARDGTTAYSDACDVCVEAETATAGQKTIHTTDEEKTIYHAEAVPVGGGILWPSTLSQSGTRQLDPGPDHVVGKPNGTGITAAEEDYYGVLTPGSGSLDLYYYDSQYQTLLPWEIDSVQQTLDVLTWNTSANTDTDSFVIAHRDRWLNWWVAPSGGYANTVLVASATQTTFDEEYTVDFEEVYREVITGDWTVDDEEHEIVCVKAGWWRVGVNYRFTCRELAAGFYSVQGVVYVLRDSTETSIIIGETTSPGSLKPETLHGHTLYQFEAGDRVYAKVTPLVPSTGEWGFVQCMLMLEWAEA